MDKLEYIPGDLISVYVGVKKYIVEVIGTSWWQVNRVPDFYKDKSLVRKVIY